MVVANANSADMAIVKTGTPNPVTEGTPLTYTLAVTNNGPASATNVTVTDTLPSVVTYLSDDHDAGFMFGSGRNRDLPAGHDGERGHGDDHDPDDSRTRRASSRTQRLFRRTRLIRTRRTIPRRRPKPLPRRPGSRCSRSRRTPALTRMARSRVLLTWKTGGEAHNLGFNVYREQNGNRVRMNPSVIAGSAC